MENTRAKASQQDCSGYERKYSTNRFHVTRYCYWWLQIYAVSKKKGTIMYCRTFWQPLHFASNMAHFVIITIALVINRILPNTNWTVGRYQLLDWNQLSKRLECVWNKTFLSTIVCDFLLFFGLKLSWYTRHEMCRRSARSARLV